MCAAKGQVDSPDILCICGVRPCQIFPLAGFTPNLRCADVFGLKVHDPVLCPLERHRFRDAKALRIATPELRETGLLAQSFNSFSKASQIQAFCHHQNRCHHLLLFRIKICICHERTINFQAVHGQTAQRGDGGMASAKSSRSIWQPSSDNRVTLRTIISSASPAMTLSRTSMHRRLGSIPK